MQKAETQAWIWNHLHLAESLGAETARLTGVNIGAEILAYARLRDVTQIVLGQAQGLRKFMWWWPGSLTAHLLNSERSMDIIVIPFLPKNRFQKISVCETSNIWGSWIRLYGAASATAILFLALYWAWF
jgi:Osmosensitive K+ channel histidine kinase